MLRSFGRRRGRKLRVQKNTLVEELLPQIKVTLPEYGELPLADIFPPMREYWFEIGFGAGEHIAGQAAQNKDIGFIGCEPYENGVATLLGHIEAGSISNIRIYTDDARDLLRSMPAACMDRLFVLFPDPWPKARHHKRRVISTESIELFARALKPGGELRIATDHYDYGVWILQHMLASPSFKWLAASADDWNKSPVDWIPTRYEQKTRAEGRNPIYLRYQRI